MKSELKLNNATDGLGCDPKTSRRQTNAVCQTKYSETQGLCLNLRITRGEGLLLHRKGPADLLSSDSISRVQEMTLIKLLTTVKLSIEAKRVIGLVLARTVLHLLGGKWIISPESLDNVSFYFTPDEDGKPILYFDQAFMPTKFRVRPSATPKSPDGPTEELGNLPVSPVEGLLALGKALAKIELGEDYPRVERDHLLRFEVNPIAVRNKLLDQCMLHSALPPSSIRFCLNGSSLKEFENYERDDLLKSKDFINDYYKGVIRPLEGWLIKNNWSWDDVNRLESYKIVQGGICHLIRKPGPEPRKNSLPSLPVLVVNPEGLDKEVRVLWSGQPPDEV